MLLNVIGDKVAGDKLEIGVGSRPLSIGKAKIRALEDSDKFPEIPFSLNSVPLGWRVPRVFRMQLNSPSPIELAS